MKWTLFHARIELIVSFAHVFILVTKSLFESTSYVIKCSAVPCSIEITSYNRSLDSHTKILMNLELCKLVWANNDFYTFTANSIIHSGYVIAL